MGQTVRRQPGEVDIPSKDYIYHKNLISFKGLDTRENPLVTDPLSCSDAENVWVDSNGNLTTRPRLQYVRQNLKHANAEVVNVIYTDNAYWTLYIKDAVYYLTRTDLATDTETDFTIPTITSPKIAITEYKNVYYLGCSAGYYSCNAGNTVFQQVSGYIPVGHLGESGYVYDEARNILNSQMRLAQIGELSYIWPSGTILNVFSHYAVVYQQVKTGPTEISIELFIWDLSSGTRYAKLIEVYSTPDTSNFGIYISDTEVYIVSCGLVSDGAIHVWRILLDTDGNITDYRRRVLSLAFYFLNYGFYNNNETRKNAFAGLNATTDKRWCGVSFSNSDLEDPTFGKPVMCAVSYHYLQWDVAHVSKRTGNIGPASAAYGQHCWEAVTINCTAIMSDEAPVNEHDFYEAAINTYRWICRVGVYMLEEHDDTGAGDAYALVYMPEAAYVGANDNASDGLVCIVSKNGKYTATNTTARFVAVGNLSSISLRGTGYVLGWATVAISNYPAATYAYQSVAIDNYPSYLTISVTSLEVLFYLSDTTELQQWCAKLDTTTSKLTVTKLSVAVSDLGSRSSSIGYPRMMVAGTAERGYYLYSGITSVADITANASRLPAGFWGGAGVLAWKDTAYRAIAYRYQYITKTLDEYTAENPSLRGVLFLDNVYWWFGKTSIYGTANEDLTYMPESRKLDAPSEIRNWVRLTDTSFLVFCESDTCLYYKDTSSGLWLRTVLNLPFEILYPDETSESCYAALNTGPTYVTRNGIYEIALSENLFTNERQAQNISDPLVTLQGGLLRKLIPSIAHLQTVRYKDWQLYIFTRANATKTEVIAQEITTYNFFYWTLPIVFQAVYLAHSQVYLVTKKATTYTFSEAELLREYKNGSTVIAAIKCYGDEVYDTVKKTTSLNQIDWHWHSAIINLDTVQYYKTLLALIFGMNDYDDESRIMFEYRTDIYYKSHTEQPTQVYDDYVYKIRATQKPMAIPRFMYIRVRISSVKVPENEDCLPEEFMCKANLSQLTFKYKVLRGPLL